MNLRYFKTGSMSEETRNQKGKDYTLIIDEKYLKHF